MTQERADFVKSLVREKISPLQDQSKVMNIVLVIFEEDYEECFRAKIKDKVEVRTKMARTELEELERQLDEL